MGLALAEQIQFDGRLAMPTQPLATISHPLQIDGFLEEWPDQARVYQDADVTLYFAQHLDRVYGLIQTARDDAWQLSWGNRDLPLNSQRGPNG